MSIQATSCADAFLGFAKQETKRMFKNNKKNNYNHIIIFGTAHKMAAQGMGTGSLLGSSRLEMIGITHKTENLKCQTRKERKNNIPRHTM